MSDPASTATRSRSRFPAPARVALGVLALVAALGGSAPASPETAAGRPFHSMAGQDPMALYKTHCAVCHGTAGFGDGMVAKRADELAQLGKANWTPPTSLHEDVVRLRPDGHLFNTITNGIRNMPAYGSQIAVEDRWAIVAYVRALQRSQNARVEDVPEDLRPTLR